MPSRAEPESHDPLRGLRDAVSGRPAPDVLEEIARAVGGARTFLIAAHINPDGDALGSQAALGLALRSLGKHARVITGQEPPEKFGPLFPAGLIEVLPLEAAASLPAAEICILLDTSAPDRAGAFQKTFFAAGQRRICLDHHLPHPRRAFDHELVVTEAPATGCLVLALLDSLGVRLDHPMAQALWIALATDTGWFRFSNTTSWALRDAARLVALGLDTEALHDRIYESFTLARAHVLGRILSSVRQELGGALIWSIVERDGLIAEGLGIADLDGMVDHLKGIRGARVIAFVVEVDRGTYKVSLRARGDGEVESIARAFGGGGHAKAAGYRFQGALPDLVARLAAAVAGVGADDRGPAR